jgi:hypothetical protein
MSFWNRKKPAPEQTAEDELVEKVNELQQLLANADSTWRSQMGALISGGYDNADTMHNVYLDYGYPASLSFENFWNMYRRFGIAKNVVDLPVDVGWMNDPVITSETEQFNSEFETLDKDVKFLTRAKGLDKRQRVGRYAGMFMRVRDGKHPSEPLTDQMPGTGALMAMVPMYEGQLEVLETDNDPTSERYTLPITYQFKGSGTGSRNENAADSFTIHWTRVVVAAEGADNGGIYGIPALEAGYNSLMDLRKIIGAGGEGFYRNAAQSVMFKLDTEKVSGKVDTDLLDKFNENFDEFTRNRMRRGLWTPGMDPKTLDSDLMSPEHHFKNALNDVSAGSTPMIPATILVGQQTGRLASNEDSRSFLSSLNSRNNNHVTDMLRDLIDWCIRWGILPSADYSVEWADLLALSDQEKLENAFKMADTNAKQTDSGGELVFSDEEIREKAGFDELEDPIQVNELSVSEARLNNARSAQAMADAATKLALGGEELLGSEYLMGFVPLTGVEFAKRLIKTEPPDGGGEE